MTVLEGVSFSDEDGAVTGLLGPNGAGKTTTPRTVCGPLQPDEGMVAVDGIDVRADPLAARARLGVLPESRGTYTRLTAREHVKYFGQLHDLRGSDLDRRYEAILERLDMEGIADRRTKGFSRGERTKVALARAMVHQPQNVLLDGPTTGLDVMSVRAIRELVHQMRSEGRCFIYSSHVMQEVSALCDSIVIVANGWVVAEGSPGEIRERTGHDDLEDAFIAQTHRGGGWQ